MKELEELPVYDRSINYMRKNRRGTTMVVYGLVDPRDGRVKYIGITNNLLARFNEHVKQAGRNKRKHAWIKELLDAHLLPYMLTLEVVKPSDNARACEVTWIKIYTEAGYSLFNDEVKNNDNPPDGAA